MQKKDLINWLKILGITILLVVGFSVVRAYADPGDACTGNSDCNISAGEICVDGECALGNLDTGGTGLSIPTGNVAISGDIVQDRSFGDLVKDIVNYFIGFLGFLATLVFVYAGVLWVLSGGNEEQITKAKKMMIYAGLGLIIVILSFSIVQFITSSAGGSDGDGDPVQECTFSSDCGPGEYCNVAGNCVQGNDMTCDSNDDCISPKICDIYGFCRNPNANPGSTCSDNTDCPTNYVCNQETNKCELGGSGSSDGAIDGSDSEPSTDDIIGDMDDAFTDLIDLLDGLNEDIENLPDDVEADVNSALADGTLSDKQAAIEALMDDTEDPLVLAVLERILDALELLEDLREDLDELRLVMPESEDLIEAYDETSEALDNLIDDPLSTVKLNRFEKRYRELKNLIRQFPVVDSAIRAAPGGGNVPFTVTFDGLNSVDPTGGTISDYKWSYLDNNGSTVSLGNKPVVVHEFTEPNTYSVRLQVSTSQIDSAGYKTAADGVSYVRIQASPPASQVAFRINGTEVTDVYHVTLKEATAGLTFDPSPTEPALGRTILKYEWLYGDTNTEERTTPSSVVHSYNKAGEYYVTLKVTDNQGVVDRRVIKLYVKSLAADIEISPTEGNVNTEFHFQGINSRSDDGAIDEYEWQVEDEEGIVVAESGEDNFYHTFDSPGEYDVILLVTDVTGAKDKHLKVLDIFSRDPVASFSYTIPEANHPNKVEFNAINSYDPDQGDKVTYSWDFNGDGEFEVVNTEDIRVEHEYNRVGEYRVTLQVEDSFNKRDQSQKGVTIDSVLSGDIILDKRAAQVGEEITFEASSSNAVAYLWEFGDGETSSTEKSTVNYTYNKKGKYKVKLNFFDDNDDDNSDSTYMLIGDGDEPIAVASTLLNSRDIGLKDNLCGEGKHGIEVTRADTLLFTAADSINTDGSSRLLSYNWEISDGTKSSRKEFTHKFDEINREGECFKASVIVRDQISGKVSDEDEVYFKVVNEIPTILDFIIEGEDSDRELTTPTKVKLRVVSPKDSDGQVKKYRWWYYRDGYEDDKIGVHSTSTADTELVITAEGQPDLLNKYYFVVEVTDNDGGVYNSTERFGEVSYLDVKNGPNLSPVAEFTIDKTTISVGDSISFISKSYDPQGDELPNESFRWDFDGDGAFDDTSSGGQVNRQFNTPGEYEVRLKVVHRGLSSSVTKTIYVEQVDSFPQAAFTFEVDGSSVSFDASNSKYDPDLEDTTLRFEWDFDIFDDENGNGINDDDVQSTDPRTTFTYPDKDLYRVRLKVKDSIGMEGVVVRDIDLNMSAEEREQNTYRSLSVSSPNQPLTTLEIAVSPSEMPSGSTADLTASVINADNSLYFGKIYFEIMEGSGTFTPNPVEADGANASTIFTALDKGTTRIKVRATDTYYGEISEDIVINVK